MTEKNNLPPTRLMAVLAARASDENLANADLAEKIGVSYPYLMLLLSGGRDTRNLSRKMLMNCASYLGIPVAEAYLLAGVLEPTDFVCNESFEQMKWPMYDAIASNPLYGPFMPTRQEWHSLSDPLKLLVIFSFEQATGIKLIKDEDKTMLR